MHECGLLIVRAAKCGSSRCDVMHASSLANLRSCLPLLHITSPVPRHGDSEPQTSHHQSSIMSTDVQSSNASSMNGASTTSVIEGSPGRAPDQTTSQHNLGQSGAGTRKDTSGRVAPAEEEGGAARGTTDNNSNPDQNQKPPEPEGGYPEQMHAGKLEGYGPEYGKMHKVTMKDRIDGVTEIVKGKLKHDEALQKDGHKTLTGEKKREQQHQVSVFRFVIDVIADAF